MNETKSTPAPRRRWDPWPVSIVVFFTVAIAGAVAFVVFCNLNSTDLVTPDYYEQELRFQAQMDRAQRGQELGTQAGLTYDAKLKQITLAVPPAQAVAGTAGDIHLYRPSAAGLDRRIKLQLDTDGRQHIDATALLPGLWKVKVLWTAGGQDYFIDEKLVIPSAS